MIVKAHVCVRCGGSYDPTLSEAIEPFRYCTPECEGDDCEEMERDDG